MSQVQTRENTFKVLLSNFPKRPTFEELHKFVHVNLALRPEQVKRLQINHAQNCAHVKCSELKIAQDIVAMHNEKHELVINKTKVKVRLMMEDGGVEVKIHDLSENVTDDEIVAFLRHYGDVLSIQETVWGEKFAFRGVSPGIRIAKMVLRHHIKSFVTIRNELTLVTYTGQPATCRHCTLTQHIGMLCVENKKLLGQKADLSERLKSAQTTAPQSYAGVVNEGTSTTVLQTQTAPPQTNPIDCISISGTDTATILPNHSTDVTNELSGIGTGDEHQIENSRNEESNDEEMSVSLTPANMILENNFKIPFPIRDPKTSPSLDTISESESDISPGGSAPNSGRRGPGRPKKKKTRH